MDAVVRIVHHRGISRPLMKYLGMVDDSNHSMYNILGILKEINEELTDKEALISLLSKAGNSTHDFNILSCRLSFTLDK
jgi:hypothetical protein